MDAVAQALTAEAALDTQIKRLTQDLEEPVAIKVAEVLAHAALDHVAQAHAVVQELPAPEDHVAKLILV